MKSYMHANEARQPHRSKAMASNQASRTPDDISITPRNLQFDVEPLARDWHGGDAFKTAFYNALSIMFPIGEQHFIDSVKYYRDRITDPALAADVRGFTAQESIPRREHQTYNETLSATTGKNGRAPGRARVCQDG